MIDQDDTTSTPEDSFGQAEAYADLGKDSAERPSLEQLEEAAGPVLELIQSTRDYLDKKEIAAAGKVTSPGHLADVAAEVRAEFLNDADVTPAVKKMANLFISANLDRETGKRLDGEADDNSTLRRARVHFLAGLRELVYDYPDLTRPQLESWLAKATGDNAYAKERVGGLAIEVATYEALMDLTDISQIRFGIPQEDLRGGDLIFKLPGREQLFKLDLKSSRPDDAHPSAKYHDHKNSSIRVWLPPRLLKDFAWEDPEAVREYYCDQVLGSL